MEGTIWQRTVSHLQEVKVAPDWEAARKQGSHSLSYKETHTVNNLNKLETDLLQSRLWWDYSPGQHLIAAWGDPEDENPAKLCPDFGPRETAIINVLCSINLCICGICYAEIENVKFCFWWGGESKTLASFFFQDSCPPVWQECREVKIR